MSGKPTLQDIFPISRLTAVAVEATLGRLRLIRARYRLKDALASIAMRFGNVGSNLLTAGMVLTGCTAADDARFFTISPTSP